MTTEEKFHAAVNVIRSLPKNGSYQPSNELMLRFYGYFKQATEGPCPGSRPGFWDIVGRAKYDAWKNLGNMSKTNAMAKYVEELHNIVETMSFSDKVANFLEAPSNELESLNMDDLELIAGDVLERVRSQPNSPLASREASPHRLQTSSSSGSLSPTMNLEESDHSDDEYIDTIEAPEPRKYIPNGTVFTEHISRSRTKSNSSIDISQEISRTVQSLKSDMDKLTNRINTLEQNRSLSVRKKSGLFSGLSPQLIAFIIAWPFIANFIMNKLMRSRRL